MALTSFLLFFLWTSGAWAAASQDMQIPRQQAAAWLEQRARAAWPGVTASAEVGRVDSRLRLPACAGFEFDSVGGGPPGISGSLEARCVSPVAWRIFLGYRLRVSGPAWVARRNLPAREKIAGPDLEKKLIEYETIPNAYLDPAHLPAGAVLNRPLARGEALREAWLSRPPVILPGQSVRVQARGEGFRVVQEGVAQGRAAAGERIRVKTRSGRMVEGVALENGDVEVAP